MAINFDRIDIKVNETGLLADSASLSISNAVQPVYSMGKKGVVSQSPTGPVSTSLSASYFMDSRSEPNLFIIDDIRNMIDDSVFQPATVSIGDLSGQGYLNRFSFSSSPNQPSKSSVEYTIFEPLSGTLQGKADILTGDYIERSISHGWGVIVNTQGGYLQDPIVDLNYEFQASWRPVYKIGQSTPIQVNLDAASEVFSFVKFERLGIEYSGQGITGVLISNFGTTGTNHIEIYDIKLAYSGDGIDALNNNINKKIFDLTNCMITQEELSVNIDDVARVKITAQQFY